MLYDIQSVRFVKTTAALPVKDNQNADFICLGHFDMMHIKRLGELTDKPLLGIQDDCKSVGESGFGCSENYVYSLYILKRVSKSHESALTAFWESKDTYTVVTRIHCDYPSVWNKGKKPFSTIIEEHCYAQTQPCARVVYKEPSVGDETCIITFSSAANRDGTSKTDVKCLFYDSLELGDTVSIIKGNSLAAILEVIRCISTNQCVRDTYTYCGIDRLLIQDVSIDVPSRLAPEAELTHISTRFSIRDVKNANFFFKELKQELKSQSPHFYVTGTADRAVHWNICKEEHLIDIVRALTKLSGDMHWCFNDVITRIGINQEVDDNTINDIVKQGKPGIESIIPSFHKTMQWLRSEIKKKREINWHYTLLKLLGTLESMYTNYVMDDLANLIIPSVGALLERINFLREHNGDTVPDKYDNDIIQFLNSWAYLTNDIAQLESQLTQHPEFSPVRYYIPAMVLQFELSFVEYCCFALSIEKTRNYIPMLIPADTPDLYTLCPLDPRQEAYSLSCPLMVFIPFKDLYRPWETAFRIAHEMAHYCEDPSRERIVRQQALLKCTAVYITKIWYDKYVRDYFDDPNGALYQASIKYSDTLFEVFWEKTQLDYPDEQWYLSQTAEVVSQFASNAILSDYYLEQYLFNVNAEYFFMNQKDYSVIRKEMRRAEQSIVQLDDYERYKKLLTFLCAECYADIAMVILTECSFEDYYTSVYKDEYLRFKSVCNVPSKLYEEPAVMRQVVRMALVIRTINQMGNCIATWAPDSIIKNQNLDNPLVNCAVAIVKESNSCTGFSALSRAGVNISDFASADDFNIISGYLEKSAETLVSELSDSTNERYNFAQFVRQGINFVRHDAFDWANVQQYILSNTSH